MSLKIKHSVKIIIILLTGLTLASCAVFSKPAPAPPPAAQFSLRQLGPQDQWHMLYLKDQPAGISHFSLQPSELAGTYRIESFFLMRYTLLGLPQEFSIKGQELVFGDLDLQSFIMEGKLQEDLLKLEGKVEEGALYVKKEFRGRKEQRKIPLPVPLKSSLAQYFMPLLVGPQKGLTMNLAVFKFDPQDFVEVVTVTLEDSETLASGKTAFILQNQMSGLTSYTWVSPQGEVLEERMLGGLIKSEKVGSEQAQNFLLGQALAKTDLLLDFSLVPVDKKIEHPETLKNLTVEIQGLESPALPQDGRQRIMAAPAAARDSLTVKIEKEPSAGPEAATADNLTSYLASTPIIQSQDPKIEEKAREIVGKATDPRQQAERLNYWVYRQLKKSFRESYSAREALEVMEGECQSHAKLYAALGRAVGLPTRVVNGLVYVPATSKDGFLYHAWNEVYLNRWVAVDPTLGQFPADVTHIKLTEGEGFKEIAPLAATVGRLKIRVVGEER